MSSSLCCALLLRAEHPLVYSPTSVGTPLGRVDTSSVTLPVISSASCRAAFFGSVVMTLASCLNGSNYPRLPVPLWFFQPVAQSAIEAFFPSSPPYPQDHGLTPFKIGSANFLLWFPVFASPASGTKAVPSKPAH